MACAICNRRKEKRFCPAIHGRICAQCCGEQREVTLDCPSECVYLQQARAHERPRAAGEIDQSLLFLEVEVGEPFLYEHQHLIAGLSFALARTSRADRHLHDTDLIAALSSLARTYQTLVNSGLHYESPVTDLGQQAVTGALQQMVKEYREAEQKHLGQARLRDSEVLRALVFLTRLGLTHTSGRPKSRAFIDFLFAQFPEKESVIATPQETGSRLIVP